jgi:hypothetical protein
MDGRPNHVRLPQTWIGAGGDYQARSTTMSGMG